MSSKDLEFDQKVDWSWGSTRLARAALESLYYRGELIIHHKIGTRKVYDFAKNHIPEEIFFMEEPNPTRDKYYQWIVKRRIGGVGFLWNRSGDAWLGIRWMGSVYSSR